MKILNIKKKRRASIQGVRLTGEGHPPRVLLPCPPRERFLIV